MKFKLKSRYKWTIFSLILLLISSLMIAFKVNLPFRPLIMNYESYLSEPGKEELEKDFDYREFGDVSEFTKAIEDKRTIGGVGSDFQIARLVQKNLIQKIDWSKLFQNSQNEKLKKGFKTPANYYSLTKKEKEAVLARKRRTFESLIRPEIVSHIDEYDKFLVDEKGNKIDSDKDGIADRFWEFFVPYYTQDKVIAYTVGDYKNKNNEIVEIKPELLKNEKYRENKAFIQEKGIKFLDQTVAEIGKTLREYGYKYFEWTEAMRDNLLLGSEKIGNYTGIVTKDNYKQQIDGFVSYIKDITNKNFADLRFNYYSSSGLDLTTNLIDIEKKPEVGFIYNGDALDAHYSKDNFDWLKDGKTINIIRPKNNLTLLDGWILLKDISSDVVDKFYNSLYNSVYKGEDLSENQMFKMALEKARYKDPEDDQIKSGYYLDYEKLPNLANFDFINYTPSFTNTFEFFKKTYFNDNVETVNALDDNNVETGDEIDLIKDKNGIVAANETTPTITFEQLAATAEERASLFGLNIYLSQQPKQTIYGQRPEDFPNDTTYDIHYSFIAPVDENLDSNIRTYYIIKTKS
ncbi:spermidine/putrescine substrate binding protein [Mesomycoplasma hyorhinis]|uniref:spermidine/putrescine substrate binding protein n=1 Tax=Mesomycoplasma hyorhinis TaxID=2100 RepID=UPI001C0582E3|nr:spermidine/putrescine substrate binding protein [Mesomycoplasma hyorhinis]